MITGHHYARRVNVLPSQLACYSKLPHFHTTATRHVGGRLKTWRQEHDIVSSDVSILFNAARSKSLPPATVSDVTYSNKSAVCWRRRHRQITNVVSGVTIRLCKKVMKERKNLVSSLWWYGWRILVAAARHLVCSLSVMCFVLMHAMVSLSGREPKKHVILIRPFSRHF